MKCPLLFLFNGDQENFNTKNNAVIDTELEYTVPKLTYTDTVKYKLYQLSPP